jgi:hypothetical protein
MPRTATPLQKIKALNLKDWSTTFWIVRRQMATREASYTVLRVDVDRKFENRLRGYVKAQVQDREYHETPYNFSSADTDDVMLTLEESDTDFPKIRSAIARGFENSRVREYSDLMGTWAYVVQFERGRRSLFAVRKTNSATDPKRVISKGAAFFENHRLVDVDDKELFLIDPTFDFYVSEDAVFISDKRGFETAMNFREGMTRLRDEVLTALEQKQILSDVPLLRTYVGNNMHHLRKLASIQRAQYYTDPNYLQRLKLVNDENRWGLKFVGNQISVEAETIELLLTLLNNDRLRSPINDELFDSGAKQKVQGP